jgi:uncharacterized membrane protein (UPF0127 family)
MPEQYGMLFLFDTPGSYGFWMKDMQFPIDILWIRGWRLVGFTEEVPTEPGKPPSELSIYYPPEEVDRVLEVNAGVSKRFGFKEGDRVVLQ